MYMTSKLSDCIFTEEIDEEKKTVNIYCNEDGYLHTYNYNLVNNTLYPIWCNQKRWDFLNDSIQYNDDDIILATYPKCGTTWLEQILILMKYGVDKYEQLRPAIRNNYDLSNNIGKIHIEGSVEQTTLFYDSHEISNNISLEDFKNIPFRIIKTHASYNTLLGKDQLFGNNKIIIVTRNPMDSAVSGYYHYNNIRNYAHKKIHHVDMEKHIGFDWWSLLWMQGKVAFGSWFDWTRDWYKVYTEQKETLDGIHIHWIFYENLKHNTMEELIRLNSFLNCQLSLEELKTIKEMTTFETMKKQAESNVYDELNSDVHFRKGMVGDWKHYFTEEIADMYKTKLHDLKIEYQM